MLKRMVYVLAAVGVIAIAGVIYMIWDDNNDTNLGNNNQNNNEENIDENEEEQEVSIYDTLSQSMLYKYLYKDKSSKLIYEGGPSHWGSRVIEYTNDFKTDNSIGVNLKVTDSSDLKGEEPAKVWNEKWELKTDGLYIDNVLAIKYPIAIGQSWQITNYSPIIDKNKKYAANIEIIEVNNDFNDGQSGVEQIKTKLTIDTIPVVSGGVYTETTTYEERMGVIKKEITEPSTEDLILSYWFDRKGNI